MVEFAVVEPSQEAKEFFDEMKVFVSDILLKYPNVSMSEFVCILGQITGTAITLNDPIDHDSLIEMCVRNIRVSIEEYQQQGMQNTLSISKTPH